MSSRSLGSTAAIALLLAVGVGCGLGRGNQRPDADAPLDVIVMPDDDGQLPPETQVTCGRAPFPLGAFESLVPLPSPDPPGFQEAFDEVLAGPIGQSWSPDGWSILTSTDSDVQLIHIGRIGSTP